VAHVTPGFDRRKSGQIGCMFILIASAVVFLAAAAGVAALAHASRNIR
jgi:hypothetical protein